MSGLSYFYSENKVELGGFIRGKEGQIIGLEASARFEVLDLRGRSGTLWVIGGIELSSYLYSFRKKGLHFCYMPKGCAQTEGKAAWYLDPKKYLSN
jgi:hypothetical protein